MQRHKQLGTAALGAGILLSASAWLLARGETVTPGSESATATAESSRGAHADAEVRRSMPLSEPPYRPLQTRAVRPSRARAELVLRAEGEPSGHDAPAERARARAELDLLSRQDPRSFLAVFAMMKQQHGDVAELPELERATAGYIDARARILQRMLSRFIENPAADHGAELEELTRLHAEYRRQLDWFARTLPDVDNFDQILATTTLKLPSFLEHPDDQRPSERASIALGEQPQAFAPDGVAPPKDL